MSVAGIVTSGREATMGCFRRIRPAAGTGQATFDSLRPFRIGLGQISDLIEGGSIARAAVQKWIASDAAGSAVRELQALGDVSVGMCSCGEFVEL